VRREHRSGRNDQGLVNLDLEGSAVVDHRGLLGSA
jgi:hypothetical protein